MQDRTNKAFAARIRKVTRSVGFADITDAGMTKAIDFAAALPADAIFLSLDLNVSAAFDDGAAGTVKCDVGVAGTTTAFLTGGADNVGAIGRVGTVLGAQVGAFVGAVTPRLTFTGSVNLNTLTTGALVATIYYIRGDAVSLEERG